MTATVLHDSRKDIDVTENKLAPAAPVGTVVRFYAADDRFAETRGPYPAVIVAPAEGDQHSEGCLSTLLIFDPERQTAARRCHVPGPGSDAWGAAHWRPALGAQA